MSDHAPEHRSDTADHEQAGVGQDSATRAASSLQEEVSLADLMSVAWGLRGWLVALFAGAAGIAGLIIAIVLLVVPAPSSYRLPFQINFPGVLDGEYPNGVPFQPIDVVSPTVMRRVFNIHSLEQHLPFESFKAAFTVREYNERMETIRLEYQAKLSSTKLTQAERSALEDEFAAKRRAARTGEFELVYLDDQDEGLPREVVAPIMANILETWAEEAQRVKGAYLYDVTVLSEAFLDRPSLIDEEYITALDMVRQSIKRLLDNITELEEIPGIKLVHVDDQQVGVAEVKLWLEDLQRFKVDPLIGQVRGLRVFKDQTRARLYIKDQLFRIGLEADAARKKAQLIEQVLDDYHGKGVGRSKAGVGSPTAGQSVLIPQLDEGFLDRIMTLSIQSTNVEYRRELADELVEFRKELVEFEKEEFFYKSMLDIIGQQSDEAAPSEMTKIDDPAAFVAGQFDSILSTLERSVRYLNEIYVEASARALKPTDTYTLRGPLATSGNLPLGTTKLALIVFACVAFAGVIALGLVVMRVGRLQRHVEH